MDIEQIIRRIKSLCAERGIKQSFFFESVGKSRGLFQDWKAGKSKPTEDFLNSAAGFFGVSVDYILCKTDEKENRSDVERLQSILARNPGMLEFIEMFETLPKETRQMIVGLAKQFAKK